MDIPARAVPAPDRRLSLLVAGLVWTLIVMMIVPEGFNYAMLASGATPSSGSFVSRSLWLGLLVLSAMIVLWRASLTMLLLRNLNPFLIAFAALAFASIVWSIEPMLTVRRDIRLITILLTCTAFALAGWHPRRLQAVVRPILTLMLVGSVIFGLTMPQLAIHQETSPELLNAWRGLTNHKNSLGALAGVTLLFWLQGWAARDVRPLRAILCCLLAGLCIWLSRSATSLIATVFAAAFLGLLTQWPRSLQPYFKYAVIIVVITVTVYSLAMLRLIPGQRILLAPITAVSGFDTTFTGRSEIWMILTDHIRQHPLFGTGYGAYWSSPTPASPSYEFVTRMNGFYPGTAHNGYLEIANDLGWTGLLCLLGYMAVQLRQSLQALVIDKPQAALYLTLFMHQTISNLSESHWLSVLSVQFVLTTLTTVALARLLLEQRMRQAGMVRAYAQQQGWSAPGAPHYPGRARS
jgi:O-antigen ligase